MEFLWQAGLILLQLDGYQIRGLANDGAGGFDRSHREMIHLGQLVLLRKVNLLRHIEEDRLDDELRLLLGARSRVRFRNVTGGSVWLRLAAIRGQTNYQSDSDLHATNGASAGADGCIPKLTVAERRMRTLLGGQSFSSSSSIRSAIRERARGGRRGRFVGWTDNLWMHWVPTRMYEPA